MGAFLSARSMKPGPGRPWTCLGDLPVRLVTMPLCIAATQRTQSAARLWQGRTHPLWPL
jgi:hypothetical protein